MFEFNRSTYTNSSAHAINFVGLLAVLLQARFVWEAFKKNIYKGLNRVCGSDRRDASSALWAIATAMLFQKTLLGQGVGNKICPYLYPLDYTAKGPMLKEKRASTKDATHLPQKKC